MEPEDIIPLGGRIKMPGGAIAHNMGGDIILIGSSGRIERLISAKVLKTKEGNIRFTDKKVILIDSGLSKEELNG